MRTFRIGRLFGIPILVNPGWFLLFVLITWLLATQVYPDALTTGSRQTHFLMAAASVILFFVSIIIHELAHSIVARAYRIPVKSITLFIFGGVAQITREATRPLNELLMAAAGPLMSMVLGGVFLGAWFAIGASDTRAIDYVLFWLAMMNFVLGIFNLVPAFPMDGGRVFRSLIWMVTGNYNRATGIAAWTGRGIAWIMMAAGAAAVIGINVYLANDAFGGVWLILIGLFLENAARQSLVQNRMVRTLQGFSAGDLMVADPPAIPGDVTVAQLAHGVLEINPRACYFVEEDGKLAGIISGYQMASIPAPLWPTTTARQVMVPSTKLRPAVREQLVSDVLLEMEMEELLHMPVVENGRVIGVIARDRILGVLKQAGLIPNATA
ncbi:site-2 protease family protein [bacterium]|nr:site-2 protease family protein [bacterium]